MLTNRQTDRQNDKQTTLKTSTSPAMLRWRVIMFISVMSTHVNLMYLEHNCYSLLYCHWIVSE